MTLRFGWVYQHCMGSTLTRRVSPAALSLALAVALGLIPPWPVCPAQAEPPEFTRNVPVWEFQNRSDQPVGYDFDAPPKGIFHTIQFSEGFEEEIGFRRSHEMVPINPTDEFHPDSRAVFIVFKLHDHYSDFQLTARCYPEAVDGLDQSDLIAEDVVELAEEDVSGYLQLFPPEGKQWKPGRYKVELHIGWEINEISLIGTMRFSVVS